MKIESLKLSTDKSKLELSISDASSIISLRLWDKDTYKDFGKLIDLSDKLTGSSSENIDILLSDLSISQFDGFYIIEAESISETSLEFIVVTSKYQECLLNKSVFYNDCKECPDNINSTIVNINTMLVSLNYAIELRFITDILTIIKALDKYCMNNCNSCGQVISVGDYENNNPDTIDIILDGGTDD